MHIYIIVIYSSSPVDFPRYSPQPTCQPSHTNLKSTPPILSLLAPSFLSVISQPIPPVRCSGLASQATSHLSSRTYRHAPIVIKPLFPIAVKPLFLWLP